ncbi:cytochrome P450 6B5-like [Plodia interpunctella]|uniref:cytochrome P450 6B5-like n=1 Tax=Plodia interpunctella TaxID=58824 RepID=UPI0023674DFF|nr:cytochrome P450 6B5-like [Plodia interpunctella]
MLIQIVLLISIALLVFIYITRKNNEAYWTKRGVKFNDRNKITGPLWDFLTSNKPLFQILDEIYKKYRDEPAVGIGGLLTPTLLVNDATNIQHLFQTDFKSFNHRGFEVNDGDHLADNILFMNGNRWKLVRQSMTPVFTSAKLKKMFYIMDKSGKDFVDYIKDNTLRLNKDAFHSISTYCCASIGAAVFGIVSESVFDSPFLDVAKRAANLSFWTNFKFSLMILSPWLSKKLNFKIFSEHEEFFIGAMKRIIRQREQEHGQKHDFADICVSLQRSGTLKDRETGLELEPTDELLSGQAFFFFTAGVDPSAASIYACLLELGRHPEHLQKVHDEIDSTFEALGGKLTYESVMDMEYLEKVLCESLRLWPPIGNLSRQCVEDTVLPVGNIKIEKGTKVFVPVYQLHHDPKHYPDPEVFDPERFASEAARDNSIYMPFGKGNRLCVGMRFASEAARDSGVYMPFGKGNRLCVGMRFARLQVKTGLIYFLRHFTVKTEIHGDTIKFKKELVQLRPSNVDITFIPRKNVKTL